MLKAELFEKDTNMGAVKTANFFGESAQPNMLFMRIQRIDTESNLQTLVKGGFEAILPKGATRLVVCGYGFLNSDGLGLVP